MKKIYILTNSKGVVPQRLTERESINITYLENYFQKMHFEVSRLSFDEFINGKYLIDKCYFYSASSQYSSYKDYILNILQYIELEGGILVPNMLAYMAHDNKMFQALQEKRLKLKSPKSYLIATYEEGLKFLENTSYPLIGKKSEGFASRNVEKINNMREGEFFLEKYLNNGIVFNIEYFKWMYKKIRYRTAYPKYHGKVIFQEFISNLEYDWKVLIFDNVCFVIKRYVNKNDFRASGSSNFSYSEEPDKKVLDFAQEVILKLDIPFGSIDIAEKDNDVYLIEYQAVHFSLTPAIKGYCHYELQGDTWIKTNNDKEIDYYFAKSLGKFIIEKEKIND